MAIIISLKELLKEKEVFQDICEEILHEDLGKIEEVIRESRLGSCLHTREIQCNSLGITAEGILCKLEIQN